MPEHYAIPAFCKRSVFKMDRYFNMPQEKRVDMCDKALKAAERPEEQKMVLEVIERYPSLPMLRLAAKAAENPALRSKAIDAMVKIAGELDGDSAEVKKLLESVGVKPQKVEIIKAEYGAGDQWKDVTKTLQSAAGNMPTISLPSPQYNSAFGGDPAPRVVKTLKVEYRIDGKSGEATFEENAPVILPMPE